MTQVPTGDAVALVVLYVGCWLVGMGMMPQTPERPPQAAVEAQEASPAYPGKYDLGLT